MTIDVLNRFAKTDSLCWYVLFQCFQFHVTPIHQLPSPTIVMTVICNLSFQGT